MYPAQTIWYVETSRSNGSAVCINLVNTGGKEIDDPGNGKGSRYLLTCAHVVGQYTDGKFVLDDSIRVWRPGPGYADKDGLKAELAPFSPKGDPAIAAEDWVVLAVESGFGAEDAIANWSSKATKNLVVHGYSAGRSLFVNNQVLPDSSLEFRLMARERNGKNANSLRLRGGEDTNPGMSGGGVFDQEGSLVGLHRCSLELGREKKKTGHFRAVDINYIRKVIGEHDFELVTRSVSHLLTGDADALKKPESKTTLHEPDLLLANVTKGGMEVDPVPVDPLLKSRRARWIALLIPIFLAVAGLVWANSGWFTKYSEKEIAEIQARVHKLSFVEKAEPEQAAFPSSWKIENEFPIVWNVEGDVSEELLNDLSVLGANNRKVTIRIPKSASVGKAIHALSLKKLNLAGLDLSGNSISREVATEINDLGDSLEYLKLNGCEIGKEQLSCLFGDNAARYRELRYLDLRGNPDIAAPKLLRQANVGRVLQSIVGSLTNKNIKLIDLRTYFHLPSFQSVIEVSEPEYIKITRLESGELSRRWLIDDSKVITDDRLFELKYINVATRLSEVDTARKAQDYMKHVETVVIRDQRDWLSESGPNPNKPVLSPTAVLPISCPRLKQLELSSKHITDLFLSDHESNEDIASEYTFYNDYGFKLDKLILKEGFAENYDRLASSMNVGSSLKIVGTPEHLDTDLSKFKKLSEINLQFQNDPSKNELKNFEKFLADNTRLQQLELDGVLFPNRDVDALATIEHPFDLQLGDRVKVEDIHYFMKAAKKLKRDGVLRGHSHIPRGHVSTEEYEQAFVFKPESEGGLSDMDVLCHVASVTSVPNDDEEDSFAIENLVLSNGAVDTLKGKQIQTLGLSGKSPNFVERKVVRRLKELGWRKAEQFSASRLVARGRELAFLKESLKLRKIELNDMPELNHEVLELIRELSAQDSDRLLHVRLGGVFGIPKIDSLVLESESEGEKFEVNLFLGASKDKKTVVLQQEWEGFKSWLLKHTSKVRRTRETEVWVERPDNIVILPDDQTALDEAPFFKLDDRNERMCFLSFYLSSWQVRTIRNETKRTGGFPHFSTPAHDLNFMLERERIP